jgi:predicted AAA+ superfamily ATPase
MPDKAFYPRFAEPRLTEALADSPIVLIHGPRQCGMTTLAQIIGERKGYAYVTSSRSSGEVS